MAYSTIWLTDDEARTFASIRMFLIALAGPWLWPDVLVAPSPDVCADTKRSAEAQAEEQEVGA